MGLKKLMTVVIMMMLGSLCLAQRFDHKIMFFSSLEFNDKLLFDGNFELYYKAYQNNQFVLFDERTTKHFSYTSKQLNEKLFSNFKIIENTYLDHERFLRGFGYLEDSVTNPFDSAGLMFSLILNNFATNLVFKDRGPLTRLFYPKN